MTAYGDAILSCSVALYLSHACVVGVYCSQRPVHRAGLCIPSRERCPGGGPVRKHTVAPKARIHEDMNDPIRHASLLSTAQFACKSMSPKVRLSARGAVQGEVLCRTLDTFVPGAVWMQRPGRTAGR